MLLAYSIPGGRSLQLLKEVSIHLTSLEHEERTTSLSI